MPKSYRVSTISAVRRRLEKGESVYKIAKELKVPRVTIHRWMESGIIPRSQHKSYSDKRVANCFLINKHFSKVEETFDDYTVDLAETYMKGFSVPTISAAMGHNVSHIIEKVVKKCKEWEAESK